MRDDWTRINLRIPIELRDWLVERAQASRRSMNNEFIACLEEVQKEAAGSASQA